MFIFLSFLDWKISGKSWTISLRFFLLHALKNNYLMLHIYKHINIIQYLIISIHYYDYFNQYDYITDIFWIIGKSADTVFTRILSFFSSVMFFFQFRSCHSACTNMFHHKMNRCIIKIACRLRRSLTISSAS